LLISSGLYDELTLEGLLIPHAQVEEDVIQPKKVGFISYPYEWSFNMLKDAALATLEIMKRSMGHGMILKDASAYNIQFVHGRPTLIDTLSFSPYVEGEPWVAYRQFCQHFINPLALMSMRDARLGRLSSLYIDGIPSDLTSSLMPLRSFLKPSLLGHVHLQSLGGKRKGGKRNMRKLFLTALVDSLEKTVNGMRWSPSGGWAEYKRAMSYGKEEFEQKKAVVTGFLEVVKPKTVWDMGSNLGEFSELASSKGVEVVAFDSDPGCVDLHYTSRRGGLPLVMDLTNPSAGIGWDNRERMSLAERGPVDLVLFLALLHHMAIGNNVPLGDVARFLSFLCRYLIIEFVPKEDPQTQKLLKNREDIFTEYDEDCFFGEFGRHFDVKGSREVGDTGRRIYLMEARR
jgi:hypothetical protein